METSKQVLQNWLAAYNARDPYALIELYHDDAINHQVAFGDPLKGREALLKSFVAFFSAFPDNYTQVENLFVDGDWEWSSGAAVAHFSVNLIVTYRLVSDIPCKVVASFIFLMAKFIFSVGTSISTPGLLKLVYRFHKRPTVALALLGLELSPNSQRSWGSDADKKG